MSWLITNRFWLLIFFVFIAMHLLGHGGHGGTARTTNRRSNRVKTPMLDLKVVSWSIGLLSAISFVLCVIYGLVVPESMHASQFLEVLPAFKWLSFWGFCFSASHPLMGVH